MLDQILIAVYQQIQIVFVQRRCGVGLATLFPPSRRHRRRVKSKDKEDNAKLDPYSARQIE